MFTSLSWLWRHGATLRRRQRHQHRDLALPHRSEEHTSELQSRLHLVCRLLLEKKIHLASSSMRSWLAVEAITKVTRKLSLPGCASVMIGSFWIPGMVSRFRWTTGSSSFVGTLR